MCPHLPLTFFLLIFIFKPSYNTYYMYLALISPYGCNISVILILYVSVTFNFIPTLILILPSTLTYFGIVPIFMCFFIFSCSCNEHYVYSFNPFFYFRFFISVIKIIIFVFCYSECFATLSAKEFNASF